MTDIPNGRIGDGPTLIQLRSAVVGIEARLQKAEGALVKLNLRTCDRCGEWWRHGPEPGSSHLYHWQEHLWCWKCFGWLLSVMRLNDGQEWDVFLDPLRRFKALDELAAAVVQVPALGREAKRAFREMDDPELLAAWREAKRNAIP